MGDTGVWNISSLWLRGFVMYYTTYTIDEEKACRAVLRVSAWIPKTVQKRAYPVFDCLERLPIAQFPLFPLCLTNPTGSRYFPAASTMSHPLEPHVQITRIFSYSDSGRWSILLY